MFWHWFCKIVLPPRKIFNHSWVFWSRRFSRLRFSISRRFFSLSRDSYSLDGRQFWNMPVIHSENPWIFSDSTPSCQDGLFHEYMYRKALDCLWHSAKGLRNVSTPLAGPRQTGHMCSRQPAKCLPRLHWKLDGFFPKEFSPSQNPSRLNRGQVRQGHAPMPQNVLRKVHRHGARDAMPVRNSIVFEVFYVSWIPCWETIGRFAGLCSWLFRLFCQQLFHDIHVVFSMSSGRLFSSFLVLYAIFWIIQAII